MKPTIGFNQQIMFVLLFHSFFIGLLSFFMLTTYDFKIALLCSLFLCLYNTCIEMEKEM